MSKLELILLGRFECLLSTGTRVALTMRKAEVLLAFLALAPGLRHPRERLINLLWSDRGEEQARNSLRQCLSAIRKSLGDAADMVLQIDRTSVCLNAELVDVDAHEFERLAADGGYESLVTAADLYQGEFLEGISIRDAASQEWLDGERGRFKRQFVEILHDLAEIQLVSHDYGNAIRSAERLVDQDPLGEAGWRLLMQAYMENGQRSHALQAFKRCRQILHRELEVDPETATIELRERIASGGAVARPATSAHLAAQQASPRAADNLHSIVVLPFDNLSGDPQQEYFSDGITESVILNLGSISDLRVKSRHTSFAFKQSALQSADIAAELGVDYVVEGSIRKAGERIRVTVQLFEAANGNQLWGRRFDSELDKLFDLEQELSLTIAGTVGGRIEKHTRRDALRKPTQDLRAYDYFMRGRYHVEHFTAQDIGIAIEQLEKCLGLDADYAPAHALLGMAHLLALYENICENRGQVSELARRHLERSLELDPHDATAQAYMAEYLMGRKEFDRALVHARKSVEINPTLADGYSMLAWHAGSTRRYDKAVEYAAMSMQIDQFHPYAGWNAGEVYRARGDYQRAIDAFRSMAHVSASVHAQIAACLAGLGRLDEARAEMRRFHDRAREQMASPPANRDEWYEFWDETMPYQYREDTDKFFELLLQAGLCEPESVSNSGMPSIAVLPFENMSGDPEQEHFADGITTDIVATLAKFRHLRTVSRYSTLQYKQDKPPIADIATQQGVRYVLEGSVRKSGERIRVSAELIDSDNGQILWNDRYDRELDDLFAVQDEITRNIALAMKVQFDDGAKAASRSAGTADIRAWELTLIAADLQDTYIRGNILESRRLAEEAIRLDPGYAFARVILAWTHFQDAYAGWCRSFEDSIAEADAANRMALELDPDYAEAWGQAGIVELMKHDPAAAIEACEKAVNLEPGNAELHALLAFALVFAEEYERTRQHSREISRLCPARPNWYYLPQAQAEKLSGNPQVASEIYRRALDVEPDSPLSRFYLVNLHMDQGDEAAARRYAEEIRSLDNNARGRGLVHSYSKNPDLRERFRANLEKFDLY